MSEYRKSDTEKRASGFEDVDEEEEMGCHNDNKIYYFGVENNRLVTKENKNSTIFCFNLNELICIGNIFSTALGLGVLTFPYILYEIGVINSLFLFLFISISIYYTLDLLRRFVVDSSFFSYSIITQATLGNCWLRIYAISAILFFLSTIVNYIKLIFNIFRSMFDSLDNTLPQVFYFIITFLIEVLLCVFTSNISKIFIFSMIIVFAFIIVFFMVLIKGIIYLSTENDNKFKYFSFFSIKNSNSMSSWDIFLFITSKFIEIFYGYIYQSTFPTLLSNLTNLENENTKRINNASFFLVFISYSIFSFFGLFCINDNNSEEKQLFINTSDLKENSGFSIIFKIIFIFYFISLIPIRYIVIRDNYTSIIENITVNVPLIAEIIITTLILLIINLVVFFIGDFDFISDFILIFGGLFGVFICMILPVISYVALNGKAKVRSIIGYIIAIIFIVFGFFSVFYNFKHKDDN
jgi:amino acid permease